MTNDTEINRLPQLQPLPSDRLPLGTTGCVAVTEGSELIHVLNREGQRLYTLRQSQIDFAVDPLLLTLQVYLLGVSNGRANLQQELRGKATEIIKLIL
jgi:hypothetical protein